MTSVPAINTQAGSAPSPGDHPIDTRRQKKSAIRSALVVLLALTFATIQLLIGGPKLVYSLPAYALLGLAGMIAFFGRKKSDFGNPGLWCVTSALLLAAYVCGRSLLSPVEYLARTDFFMTAGSVLVYFLIAVHLPRIRQRRALVWVLFALAMAHTAVGAIQFKEGQNYMPLPSIFRPDYESRASGFYICPNHLAGLLEMLGLLALGFACWARGKVWQRILAIYAVIVCVGGVAITGSRGGYLSTVIGLIVFSMLSLRVIRRVEPRRFGPMLFAALAGCAFIVAGAVFLMLYSTSLKSRLGMIYDPANMRFHLWAAALKQFALNPFVGTGSGTYLYLGRQFRSALVQADPVHVHCDYLELLAEYGIAGVGAFSLFLVVHLRRGWLGITAIVEQKMLLMRRSKSNELALVIGAFSGVTAMLAHSVVDFNLHIPANTLLVAFLFAVLATPTDAGGAVSGKSPRRAWLRWAAPLLGTALLLLAVPRIPTEYQGERARAALRDTQYEEAKQWAEKALRSEKSNPDLFYYLGEAQHYLAMNSADPTAQVRLHEAAANAFLAGLQVFPHDLRLLVKLGRTLDNLGRFPEAGEIFERAIAADPNFGNVHAYYGLHWHLQRRFKKAREYYGKAWSLGEREVSVLGLAGLERDRARPNDDGFADLISEPDMDDADDAK